MPPASVSWSSNRTATTRLARPCTLDNNRPADKDFRKTVFLRLAFNEGHYTVVYLTGLTWNNFFATWAELEVSNKYNDPVFPMNKGLTHAASPIVTGDWSLDDHGVAVKEYMENNTPYDPYRKRGTGHGWG
jgi:hypothetical protein